MYDFRKFYINGEWVSPSGRRELDVINPATEQSVGKIADDA
jgi:aldehyde dehydrogenase (NAD+)